MNQKIKNLINDNQTKIVMLGGLPAAGKSTIAKEFEKAGYLVACADTYRGILSKKKHERKDWTEAMHESDQSLSAEAWGMVYTNTINAIKKGQSVVVDGLLHTPKSRRRLFGYFDKLKVPYYSIYLDVDIKTSIARNMKRFEAGGRFVPQTVIEEKWRTQSLPSKNEGFKETIVISNDLITRTDITQEFRDDFIYNVINNARIYLNDLYSKDELEKILPSFAKNWGISQNNFNHNLELHDHMITASEKIEQRDPVSVVSMLMHDVGKVFTKEFFVKITKENDYGLKVGEKYVVLKSNDKGYSVKTKSYQTGYSEGVVLAPLNIVELDQNAHFYDHENVGAILARRDLLTLGFDEDFANEVYTYILHHMDLPFREASNKSMKKLIRKVGKERMETLLSIRKADKLSAATKPDFHDYFNKTVKQIRELIK